MSRSLLACFALAAASCAGPEPTPSTDHFAVAEQATQAPEKAASTNDAPAFDGSLEAYVDHALSHRPELKAEVERWRASRRSVDAAYVLPAPTLAYGYFFRSVETKVGPQQHRLGLTQGLPWPGKSGASEDVARAQSEVGQHRYSNTLVRIRAEVAQAYWEIWRIDQNLGLLAQQTEILKSLVSAARTRVETGQTTVADVGQVELAVSRTQDTISTLTELRNGRLARLAQALGLESDTALPISPGPVTPVPVTADPESLVAAASEHPRILALLESAKVETARAAEADTHQYPDFGIGVDWVITGESADDVPDNGKDAVVGMVTMSLPIWFDDYAANRDSAEARQVAIASDVRAARQQARGAVLETLSQLRESQRRYALYTGTLIPQAEAVYGSVLGAYEVGRGNVASIMLAQQELLELRRDQVAALSDHNQRLAALEAVVGRPLADSSTPSLGGSK